MESHKRILGILLLVFASFQVIVMIALGFLFTAIFTFAMSQADPKDAQILEMVMNLLRYLPLVIIITVSIPSFVAGLGLLYKKSWAMILALIIGCIHILSFPFGTAIGVYTIWIYTQENKLAKQNAVTV